MNRRALLFGATAFIPIAPSLSWAASQQTWKEFWALADRYKPTGRDIDPFDYHEEYGKFPFSSSALVTDGWIDPMEHIEMPPIDGTWSWPDLMYRDDSGDLYERKTLQDWRGQYPGRIVRRGSDA